MARPSILAVLVVGVLTLAGCGGAVSGADPGTGAVPPAAGMCAPEVPDCIDTVVGPDEFDVEAARAEAEALLGVDEAALGDDVRVGRRGDERFMLTEDYVLGRMTVELDAGGDGVNRVVSVTVELPDGPETFTD